MFEEYKYKTEMHTHTKPVSVCADFPAKDVIKIYKEAGADAVVITNHFCPWFFEDRNVDIYLRDYYDAVNEGEKQGISVILGAEIRFSENHNDYLLYGIDEDDLRKAEKLLDSGIDNFYKEFKNEKNLIVQAHPFRETNLANPESLDGIEVFNMHPHHNSCVALAAKYAKEKEFLITGGTDFHHLGHQGMCFLRTKEKPKDSFELARIIKSRDYVFDVWGNIIVPYNY